MKKIKLMAEYNYFPLWDMDEADNLEPEDVPISSITVERLYSWAKRYDSIINWNEPQEAAFKNSNEQEAFEQEGLKLWRQLQLELSPHYQVYYFSEKHHQLLKPTKNLLDRINKLYLTFLLKPVENFVFKIIVFLPKFNKTHKYHPQTKKINAPELIYGIPITEKFLRNNKSYTYFYMAKERRKYRTQKLRVSNQSYIPSNDEEFFIKNKDNVRKRGRLKVSTNLWQKKELE